MDSNPNDNNFPWRDIDLYSNSIDHLQALFNDNDPHNRSNDLEQTQHSIESKNSKLNIPVSPIYNDTNKIQIRSDFTYTNSIDGSNSFAISECPNSPLSSTSTTSYNQNLFRPSIQNIIASAHLQCEIDLRKVAISTRNAEYNPRKVNAVIIRIRKPRCTGLIFRTGRLMITGAKNEYDIKKGGKLMAKLIQVAAHSTVRFTNFKIENIIATVDCGFPIRLEGLANEHKEFCNYEPELFAGLVYRYNPSEHTKSVLLLFVSGKVVITGCKQLIDAQNVFENMFPVIIQFKK